jgi:predicted PhzF superfamily epimerase YddE/YHI9
VDHRAPVLGETNLPFHARNPFPPGGVIQDPATGAAAAAFGGYLRSLGLVDTPARTTILQGFDMGRPVPDDHRVQVSGTAAIISPADD